MTSAQRAIVHIERDGHRTTIGSGVTADTIGGVIESARGAHDVTLEFTPDGRDERLLVAVEGGEAVLGLVRPDSILQFLVDDAIGGPRRFTIGRQPTDIEARYCVPLDRAAAIAEQWLAGTETHRSGHWERQ